MTKISDVKSRMAADELKKIRQELPALTKELAEVASVLGNTPATNGPKSVKGFWQPNRLIHVNR